MRSRFRTVRRGAETGTMAEVPALSLTVPAVVRELLDRLPDVVFFAKDRDGRYLEANQTLLRRLGLARRELVLGLSAVELFPAPLGRRYLEQDLGVIRSGRPLEDLLELHLYPDRSEGWCLTTKLPLRDAEGNISGLIGFSRDVRAPVNLDDIPPGLASVLEFFEKNLAEPVSPSILARRAKLAPSKLARLLRRFFDLTPSQFITRTRLEVASRLLLESDRPVADIAQECGFYDHSAFSRAFRMAMGVTPSEFRRAKAQA